MSAPAPRVVLRRSVRAPSAFSRASVKSAILARPATSPLPDSIITMSCRVSIKAGCACSAAAFSFSSAAANTAEFVQTRPNRLIEIKRRIGIFIRGSFSGKTNIGGEG